MWLAPDSYWNSFPTWMSSDCKSQGCNNAFQKADDAPFKYFMPLNYRTLSARSQITWRSVVSCSTERSLFTLTYEMDAAAVGCRWSLQAKIAPTWKVKYKNKRKKLCELWGFVCSTQACFTWTIYHRSLLYMQIVYLGCKKWFHLSNCSLNDAKLAVCRRLHCRPVSGNDFAAALVA